MAQLNDLIVSGETRGLGDAYFNDLYSNGTQVLTSHQDISGKQDKLTAGNNVTISGTTISATDTTYSAASAETAGLMSASDKAKLDGIAASANNYTLPVAGTAIGGVKSGTDITVDTSGNVSVNDNSHNHTIANVTNLQSSLDNKLETSLKGAASGLAELDASGKVPTAQLPSYVDDVLEYSGTASFPTTGETGKIYVDTTTNLTYRWGGSSYTEISPSLALGETESTAYRGDRGAAAYTHAVTNKGSAYSSGLYKITTNSEGHVTAATAVTKSDITGLGIPSSDTTYTNVSEFTNDAGYAKTGAANTFTDTNNFVFNKLLFSVGRTTAYMPISSSVATSIAARDYWHDRFAFLPSSWITNIKMSTDGETWEDDTILNATTLRKLFYQKETDRVTILPTSRVGTQFVIDSSVGGLSLSYSSLKWIEIGVAYNSLFSAFKVTVEAKSNTEEDSSYIILNESTITSNSDPYFLYLGDLLSSRDVIRLTFTKTSNLTTGSVSITCVKAFTARKGDQGSGIEKEKPYNWDAEANFLPKSGGNSNLGASGTQWNNVYGKTIYQNGTKVSVEGHTHSYNDLSDLPTIPTTTSELTNNSGFLTEVPSEYVTESELTTKGYLTEVPSEYVTESELNAKGYLTSHQDISGKQDKLVSGTNIKTINNTTLLGSGNIAITSANNSTITIQKNGATVDSFTTNASSNKSINITVPTQTSELTNNSGFLTSVPDEYITETELTNKGYLTEVTSTDIKPLETKTYQNLICSSNDRANGVFYYLQIYPSSYYTPCRVKVRVTAYINEDMTHADKSKYYTETVCDLTLGGSGLVKYTNDNSIWSTSYRPIYYNTVYRATQSGIEGGYPHYLGASIYNSTNPTTTTLKRDIKVELLEYENCTVTLLDKTVLQSTFYSSTYYTSYSELDAYTQGKRMTGDNNSYDRVQYNNNTLLAGAALYGTQLALSADGYTYYSICTSRGTGTSKTCTTQGFRPEHILYYNNSTTISSGSRTGTWTLASTAPIDARYSWNPTSSLTNNKPFYLVCTLNENDGLFYLDTSGWGTQTLPTSADGKYYILIGYAYNTTNIHLVAYHPVYYYADGLVREYGKYTGDKQDTLVSGTNIKTINGNSLLGSGNIEISGGDSSSSSPSIFYPLDNLSVSYTLAKNNNTSVEDISDFYVYLAILPYEEGETISSIIQYNTTAEDGICLPSKVKFAGYYTSADSYSGFYQICPSLRHNDYDGSDGLSLKEYIKLTPDEYESFCQGPLKIVTDDGTISFPITLDQITEAFASTYPNTTLNNYYILISFYDTYGDQIYYAWRRKNYGAADF